MTNEKKSKTVMVNLFAGPGAGKTTAAHALIVELKKAGANVEYVGEYAKELVLQKKFELLKNQEHVTGEQMRRLDVFRDNVDVIVTDSPTLLGEIYGKNNSKSFSEKLLEHHNSYETFNLFIERGKDYQQVGRIETQEQSIAVDLKILEFLKSRKIFFGCYNRDNITQIKDNILTTLKRINPSVKDIKNTNLNGQPQLQRSKNIMANTVLMGRVAKELEIQPAGNKNVGKFSIAVDSREKDAEGKPIPTFYNIETWDEKYQEVLQEHLKKGGAVMVCGQLVNDVFERADGSKGNSIKVLTNSVKFVGKSDAAVEKIFVTGRLTKDVDVKTVNEKGDRVAKLSLAENYGKDNVNYYEVELWNDEADLMAKHLEKGSLIKVDGDLKLENYERADGSKGTSLKIVNSYINFLSKAASKGGEESSKGSAAKKVKSANKSASK